MIKRTKLKAQDGNIETNIKHVKSRKEVLELITNLKNEEKRYSAESNPLLTAKTFNLKNALISILAGGISGMSIDIALFPIDSIKTRL